MFDALKGALGTVCALTGRPLEPSPGSQPGYSTGDSRVDFVANPRKPQNTKKHELPRVTVLTDTRASCVHVVRDGIGGPRRTTLPLRTPYALEEKEGL